MHAVWQDAYDERGAISTMVEIENALLKNISKVYVLYIHENERFIYL